MNEPLGIEDRFRIDSFFCGWGFLKSYSTTRAAHKGVRVDGLSNDGYAV